MPAGMPPAHPQHQQPPHSTNPATATAPAQTAYPPTAYQASANGYPASAAPSAAQRSAWGDPNNIPKARYDGSELKAETVADDSTCFCSSRAGRSGLAIPTYCVRRRGICMDPLWRRQRGYQWYRRSDGHQSSPTERGQSVGDARGPIRGIGVSGRSHVNVPCPVVVVI